LQETNKENEKNPQHKAASERNEQRGKRYVNESAASLSSNENFFPAQSERVQFKKLLKEQSRMKGKKLKLQQ
jgi:hypothetical protein